MGAIQKRGNKHRAIIRKSGYSTVQKSFETKTQAKNWIQDVESQMNNGSWTDPSTLKGYSVEYVINQIINKIHENPHTVTFAKSKLFTMKRTADRDRGLGAYDVNELTPELLSNYIYARREAGIGPKTAHNELTYLSQAVDLAKTLFGFPIEGNVIRETMSVLAKLRVIRGTSISRERRFEPGEYELIEKQEQLSGQSARWLMPMLDLALDSTMRQHEIFDLLIDDLDFSRKEILIRERKHPNEKEANDQVIPMRSKSYEILYGLYDDSSKISDMRIFHNRGPQISASVSDKFAKYRDRAGIVGLVFHDSRHEAISRLFEEGLSIPEVMVFSGHTNPTQLMKYTHLRPGDVLKKLSR